jgi:hypothetical protein
MYIYWIHAKSHGSKQLFIAFNLSAKIHRPWKIGTNFSLKVEGLV